MKLLYAYIREYNVLKNEQINFDSSLQFKYTKNRELIARSVTALPESFFSVGAKKGSVDSVSIVVGKNGTGKTTLASFLSSIRKNEIVPSQQFILVWETSRPAELHCAYHLDELGDNYLKTNRDDIIMHKWLGEHKGFDIAIPKNTSFTYFSQMYMLHSPCVSNAESRVIDASTTGLLKQSIRRAVKDACTRDTAYRAYEVDEFSRMLKFVIAYKSIGAACRGFPNTERIEIIANKEGRKAHIAFISKSVRFRGSLKDDLKRVLATKADEDFFIKAFMCMITARVYKECAKDRTSSEVPYWIYDILELSSIKKQGALKRSALVRKWILGFFARYNNEFKVEEKIFEIINELCKAFEVSNKKLSAEIAEDIRSLNKIIELYSFHAHLPSGIEFLNFKLMPDHSSGELNFYAVFGRLYEAFRSRGRMLRTAMLKEMLVYLDEAETNFHPEWQRCFVWNLIWFFETFFPDRHVHIILSTHSPIILSDIPRNNVHFFGRKNDVTVDHEPLTFAANIYDLYRDTFFLQNGPIGEFARQKLLSLKTKRNDDIVNMVGDNLLRSLLPMEES